MRQPRIDETVVKSRGGKVEYFDVLKRNTYYCCNLKEVEKLWIRLPNGLDYETYVHVLDTGYWRRHNYDIHTGELLSELDSKGETNLLHYRQQWNKTDTQISLECRNKGKSRTDGATELF